MGNFTPKNIRSIILRMAYSGSTVHIGCAFSIVELMSVLYRNHLNYPDDNPNAELRDYLILSKGHGVMAQYACLYEKSWLNENHINKYFADGSDLKGLSDAHVVGCEVTSGTLGHGLSVGVGLALAAKLNKTEQTYYVIVGDGEMNEGTMWEAMLFASHHNLDNLIIIVDKNDHQAMGRTKDVLNLGALEEKFKSFNFEVLNIDGHNEVEINAAINTLKKQKNNSPKAIIAKTIKGKGVSFMEDNNIWHYTRLTNDTFNNAIAELNL